MPSLKAKKVWSFNDHTPFCYYLFAFNSIASSQPP